MQRQTEDKDELCMVHGYVGIMMEKEKGIGMNDRPEQEGRNKEPTTTYSKTFL